MNPITRAAAAGVTSVALVVAASGSAHAFRMIQTSTTGRTSFGGNVPCSDPGGFAHRPVAAVSWLYSTSNQGGEPGVASALRNAMSSWSAVPNGGYALNLAGTTNAGFVTDGLNVIHWATGEGCSGGCVALTALVLQAGQVIVESDITFNDAFDWNTNGRDYDVEAIAAHELGHTLGIHHTDKNFGGSKRPTMYSQYFGTAGRSLETDDKSALQCSASRYPLIGKQVAVGAVSEVATDPFGLSSRPRAGGALIRYRLATDQTVDIRLFDVAGRAIATLVQGPRTAGEYELAWDGTTRSGRAPSGVYFARLVTPQGSAHTTVVLLE